MSRVEAVGLGLFCLGAFAGDAAAQDVLVCTVAWDCGKGEGGYHMANQFSATLSAKKLGETKGFMFSMSLPLICEAEPSLKEPRTTYQCRWLASCFSTSKMHSVDCVPLVKPGLRGGHLDHLTLDSVQSVAINMLQRLQEKHVQM